MISQQIPSQQQEIKPSTFDIKAALEKLATERAQTMPLPPPTVAGAPRA